MLFTKIAGALAAVGVAICSAGPVSAQSSPPRSGEAAANRDKASGGAPAVRVHGNATLEMDQAALKYSRDARLNTQSRLLVTGGELRAIKKVEEALAVRNYDAAALALAAASAVAKTNEGKYSVAALQLQLGTETKNEALQDYAIDAALATGVAPAHLLPELYKRQGIAAILVKNYAKAEASLSKVVELSPQDSDAVVLLAEAKNRANKPTEALPLLEKAIALRSAANQPVPTEWTRAVGVIKAKAQVSR